MRLRQLDYLRGLAILLVFGRHLDVTKTDGLGLAYYPLAMWQRCGWAGVDLFFVLSGFLVSSLLLHEYRTTNRIRVGRFLLRRGFKIYPAFYLLLAVSAARLWATGRTPPAVPFLCELFYLQNYGQPVWQHTWSLAVEEHFYLLLALSAVSLAALCWLPRRRILVGICLAGMVGILLARIVAWWGFGLQDWHWYGATHFRLDAFLAGVLLAYVYQYHGDALTRRLNSKKAWLFVTGLVLVMPVFVFDYNHSGMLTFGLTAVYQGSAILLLAVLLASSGRPASGEGRSWAGRLLAPLSFLGFYSYSIYLWHIPVRRWLPSLLNRICGEKLPIGWELTAYLVASVVVGFGMAKLVEVPILRFRDRYFPSAARGSALTLAHPVTGTSESRVILAGDCEKPKRRLRIFVYSSALPRIDQNAGDRRFGALLQLLARNHDVDLCLGNNDGDPSNPPLAAGTEKYRRFLTGAGIRLTPFGWRHIESTLLRGDYDIGLFEFYYHARELLPLFRLYQPRARVIVDSVDVHFMRELAAADLGVMPRERAERTKRLELDTYRRADLVVALTGEDRRALEAEIQLPPIAVIPIIFPTRPRASGSRASEVLFVGGFHHLPNLDGLRWFLTEVWHRVLAVSPEARLTVIGSNAPPEVNDLAKNQGIQLLGYVPDINPYLDRAAVSVAPLRYGSGMKGKVIEAMASGLPVVSTTVGVQGLQSRPGQDVLVADDPEGFARGVIELLSNPARAQQLGLAGQRYIAGLCSPQVVAEAVEVALAIAMSRPVSGERTAWHIWRRFRFESLRLICFPYWGPRQGFRRYLKTPLCRLRNRFLRTSGR